MRTFRPIFVFVLIFTVFGVSAFGGDGESAEPKEPARIVSAETLPGTELLSPEREIVDILMLDQFDAFVSRELAKAPEVRAKNWRFDGKTPEEFQTFIQSKREIFVKMIGDIDERVPEITPVAPLTETLTGSLADDAKPYRVQTIQWPVFPDYNAEAILIDPADGKPAALEIVLPHAGMDPLDFFDHVPSLARLAGEKSTRVIIPALVGREKTKLPNGRPAMSAREFIYTTAYGLGRGVIGYELESLLSLIDWAKNAPETNAVPIRVAGYGEGGLLALYLGALDVRVDAVTVAGYFCERENLWKEPIDRNIFGFLNEFSDAELALLIYPRPLVIDSERGPALTIDLPPAELTAPDREAAAREIARAQALLPSFLPNRDWIHEITPEEKERFGVIPDEDFSSAQSPVYQKRQRRIIGELDAHNQTLLEQSHQTRQKFMEKLDFSSEEAYCQSTEEYRKHFYEKIIGKYDLEFAPLNPRSRKTYDEEKWTGYDVLIDVFDGLSAGGIFMLPKDLRPEEKRPIIVVQHGLLGHMTSTLYDSEAWAYHHIALHLVDAGYIVFTMQGLFTKPEFRIPGARKSNPIGKSLYSLIIPQHERLLVWLKTLPNVDPEKIGYYGLSYGGRTATRVPPVVTDYALAVCSADFADWALRSYSSREPYSFVGCNEYETNEFNMINTFSHAEMIALLAPRPFMIERGFFDPCGDNRSVGSECGKVRELYAGRLKRPERLTIDWFVGGHEADPPEVIRFLDQHFRPR